MILWHMHQPYYKRLDTGEHVMPWVRLHGTKDYLDMPLLVEECPGMKATFNLVPSLLEQIGEFAEGNAKEKSLEISRKPASLLTEGDRRTMIRDFFRANHDHMIAPFPRYEELYSRRVWARNEDELSRTMNRFSVDDLRDLQVWFNLSWIDPLLRKRDPFLQALVSKGSLFTEEEKKRLLETRRNILRQIVPTYQRLQEEGHIEISTTPFYHPILPLVYDTDFGRRPRPETPLPGKRFHHPGEASHQIRSACEYHRRLFGTAARGMWPSEGSVCPEIIPLFSDSGISWIATDEEILALSLENTTFKRDREGSLTPENARRLYKPYRVRKDGGEVTVFFRDHQLSDLIGFQYAGWDPEDAAEDLTGRLRAIHSSLPPEGGPWVVSIILDGENCWEFYPDDGLPFLRRLYRNLVSDPLLAPVTPSGFLEQSGDLPLLNDLYTGSWINHDFHIWIGDEEDRVSWEYLSRTYSEVTEKIRKEEDKIPPDAASLALKSLRVAEGSDWNWWYGDDHSSGMDEEFDALYRSHLMQAYHAVGLDIPPKLLIPITGKRRGGDLEEPQAFLHPEIDGRDTSYFEWLAAGVYEATSGSMHRSRHSIRRVFFGFDLENLYIRIDPTPDLRMFLKRTAATFVAAIHDPTPWRIRINLSPEAADPPEAQCYRESGDGGWSYVFSLETVAYRRILEISLPFQSLELKPGMVIHFQVILQSCDREMERCPAGIPLQIVVPDSDFEKSLWFV